MKPDSMRDRLRTIGLAFALLVLLAFMALTLAQRWLRSADADPMTITACRARYHDARSATDSTMVDQQAPMDSRLQAAAPISCGELRRSGRL